MTIKHIFTIDNQTFLLDWVETLEVVVPALPSLTMYLCSDNRRLASPNSSLLFASFDIISKRVFLRIGFRDVSLTLYSSKLNK